MSISSTGLYGSATIVNTDIFDDVQALKEEIVTLSTSYWTTTQEHRDDISQNRQDISSNLRKITDINNNRITAIEQDITDISNNRITSIEQDITDISNNRITVLAIEQDITDLSDNRGSIGAVTYEAKKKGKIRFVIYIAGERTFFFIYDVIVKQKIKKNGPLITTRGGVGAVSVWLRRPAARD